MDTTEYPSLPNLARMHARLAEDSRRVERIVDGQMDVIERLFHATTAQDWKSVANVSRTLASLEPEFVSEEVVSHARQVYEELAHTAGNLNQPKHLAALLAACRAVRIRTR